MVNLLSIFALIGLRCQYVIMILICVKVELLFCKHFLIFIGIKYVCSCIFLAWYFSFDIPKICHLYVGFLSKFLSLWATLLVRTKSNGFRSHLVQLWDHFGEQRDFSFSPKRQFPQTRYLLVSDGFVFLLGRRTQYF